jgi:signal transduction histidine kinase
LASGKHMGRLIEDMLDLARARLAGGIVVKREPGDIKALVERVVRECQAASPGRVVETVYSGDFAGHWDAERIAQVVANLIGNALKHGDPTGPVQVRLDGTKQDEVILDVANWGTIPPELVNHLFDPFRGGQRPAGRSEGLGLGLYIVYQVVKAHGGSVEVTTGTDDRTVFQVSLPRSP